MVHPNIINGFLRICDVRGRNKVVPEKMAKKKRLTRDKSVLLGSDLYQVGASLNLMVLR